MRKQALLSTLGATLLTTYAHAACPRGVDSDGDGICDGLDRCPLDPLDDIDGDGVCGEEDACFGASWFDNDADEVCNDIDPCPLDADPDAVCVPVFDLDIGPLTPGERLRVEVHRAPPGAPIAVILGLQGTGAGPCASGLCADVLAPSLLLIGRADPHGELAATVRAPASVAGSAWFQAAWLAAGGGAVSDVETRASP